MRRTLAFVALTACAWAGDANSVESPRGLLLIAIDGLRVDHVSCFGYERATTPRLDELARGGVRFDQAFSTAPAVFQANASLLTGCDPRIARRDLPPELPVMMLTHWHVPERAPHLAQELLRRGWSTAAFVDHGLLGSALGFARGFREFQSFDREHGDLPATYDTAATLERLSNWLGERSREERWFAYVHLGALQRVWTENDPTWDTYFPPRADASDVPPTSDAPRVFFAIPRSRWGGGTRTLGEYEAKYDGAIRKLDAALGRAFDALSAAGRLDETAIVVVGTRGIGFGEAGLYLDSGTLADVDLRVPLIVRATRDRDALAGGVSHQLASLIDVAPTLLELAGVSAPSEMQGLSLVSVLTALDAPTRPFAFAASGYQEGSVVIGPQHCLETSFPWLGVEAATALSWYGGALPSSPEPRVVFHARELDPTRGHMHSTALEAEVVAAMRAAEERWNEELALLRKSFERSSLLPFAPGSAER